MKNFNCKTDQENANKIKHGKPNTGCSIEGMKNWYNISVDQLGNQTMWYLRSLFILNLSRRKHHGYLLQQMLRVPIHSPSVHVTWFPSASTGSSLSGIFSA